MKRLVTCAVTCRQPDGDATRAHKRRSALSAGIETREIDVRGRNPGGRWVCPAVYLISDEISSPLQDPLSSIVQAVKSALAITTGTGAADIAESGTAADRYGVARRCDLTAHLRGNRPFRSSSSITADLRRPR